MVRASGRAERGAGSPWERRGPRPPPGPRGPGPGPGPGARRAAGQRRARRPRARPPLPAPGPLRRFRRLQNRIVSPFRQPGSLFFEWRTSSPKTGKRPRQPRCASAGRPPPSRERPLPAVGSGREGEPSPARGEAGTAAQSEPSPAGLPAAAAEQTTPTHPRRDGTAPPGPLGPRSAAGGSKASRREAEPASSSQGWNWEQLVALRCRWKALACCRCLWASPSARAGEGKAHWSCSPRYRQPGSNRSLGAGARTDRGGGGRADGRTGREKGSRSIFWQS